MRGDWESDGTDSEWLPSFDIRSAVLGLPTGSVKLEDFSWGEELLGNDRLPVIRDALQGLRSNDNDVVNFSLLSLRDLTCPEGNTSVYGAGVVSELIRLAATKDARLRGEMLELVGDLGRVRIYRGVSRIELLRTMQPIAIYDAWGYLENWAVEAVRMMIGREASLLVTLLNDEDAGVRGRAAYALVTALPVEQSVNDALKAGLHVETDAIVQMILILCIAQHEQERDAVAAALTWAESLWSDQAAPIGIRIGGAIAWCGLTGAAAPPALQRLVDEMTVPATYDLLRQLPWLWRLDQAGKLERWWQSLPASVSE